MSDVLYNRLSIKDPPPLRALAHRLVNYACSAGVTQPLLVGVADPLAPPVLTQVHALGGPADEALLGWSAPHWWSGAALVHSASAIVVDRRGRCWVAGHGLAMPRSPSPVSDMLQRALGLATPPPSSSCGAVAAAVWLDQILGRAWAASDPRSLCWAELDSIHPLSDCPSTSAGPLAPRPEELHRRSTQMSWAELDVALRSTFAELACAPLGWLDAGALARWVTARLVEPRDALSDLFEILHPEVWTMVRSVVDPQSDGAQRGAIARRRWHP
jgi:hypothetical protein